MKARVAILPIALPFFVVALANAYTYNVKFGYSGDIGPPQWGNLSPDYQLCGNGKQQSPINIVKEDALVDEHLSSLNVDYTASTATLIDNGFNIALLWEGGIGGVMNVDGKNYTMKQLHWHSPSEHTIDGEQ